MSETTTSLSKQSSDGKKDVGHTRPHTVCGVRNGPTTFTKPATFGLNSESITHPTHPTPTTPVTTSGSCSPELAYSNGSLQPKILIISNDTFDGSEALMGHKKDAQRLKEMWGSFGCATYIRENLTKRGMESETADFADNILKGTERFCAVFILSHGSTNDMILGVDGIQMDFKSVLDSFKNKKTHLQNMPKLFFLQCCRGPVQRPGVAMSMVTKTAARRESSVLFEDLPDISDILIFYATQPDEVSMVEENGSWCITELVNVFNKYSNKCHVYDMLVIVNKQISERKPRGDQLRGIKCMSEIRSTLRQQLFIKQVRGVSRGGN